MESFPFPTQADCSVNADAATNRTLYNWSPSWVEGPDFGHLQNSDNDMTWDSSLLSAFSCFLAQWSCINDETSSSNSLIPSSIVVQRYRSPKNHGLAIHELKRDAFWHQWKIIVQDYCWWQTVDFVKVDAGQIHQRTWGETSLESFWIGFLLIIRLSSE